MKLNCRKCRVTFQPANNALGSLLMGSGLCLGCYRKQPPGEPQAGPAAREPQDADKAYQVAMTVPMIARRVRAESEEARAQGTI